MEEPKHRSTSPTRLSAFTVDTKPSAITRAISSLTTSSTSTTNDASSSSLDPLTRFQSMHLEQQTFQSKPEQIVPVRMKPNDTEDESRKFRTPPITPEQSLPLTRLMERLRMDRTDERLQKLVSEQITRRNEAKSPRLILMTGPRGCGTSHVIRNSLEGMLEQHGGFFLQGKCHLHHNYLPYPSLVGAFTEFVHVVHQRNMKEEMRRVILDALCPSHIPILIDRIPALAKIIGGESNSLALSDGINESKLHQRFVFAFGAFIEILLKTGRPIVWFLQDLNLCDSSALDLYRSLVTDPRYAGLIMVGSCNSGVSGTSYLAQKLRQIEDQLQQPIINLEVNNLEFEQVETLLSVALESGRIHDQQKVNALIKLVYEYSKGNMLFITSMLRWLVHAKLLFIDDTLEAWNWDESEVQTNVSMTMTVDDYVRLGLRQLNEQARETLQIAACLGPDLYPSLLLKVISNEQFEQGVQEASQRGFLTYSKITNRYSFAHETVRVATYGSIPIGEREELHLKIGRRIFRAFNDEEMEKVIFLVLSQLKLCQGLIREDERVAVAKLCLHAGSKAARLSAHVVSLVFLEMGLGLLGKRCWRDEYELTLALSNAVAEIHMCTASFDLMDQVLIDIFANARSLHDKLPAYSTRICGLAAVEKSPEALKLGKEVLCLLGEPLPKRPTKAKLIMELLWVNRQLKQKSDEQLLRMAPATNQDKVACMQLLHLIFLDASFCDPMFCPFIATKLMKLTLRFGFSAFTAASFVYYGVTMLAHDVSSGLRYGALSLKFLERFGAKEFVPRVHFLYYGVIHHWIKPLSEAVQPLLDAYNMASFTGDLAAAGFCANAYALTCLESGERLTTLEPRIMWLVSELTAKRQQHAVFSLLIVAQTLHHYLGLSDNPLAPQGDLLNHDDAHAVAMAKGNFMNAVIVPFTRMIVAFLFDDYSLAASLVDPFLSDVWMVPMNNGVIAILFVLSMVKIQCAWEGKRRRKNLRFALLALKRLNKACPPYVLEKLYLLKAEVNSLRGNNSRASRYYLISIAIAHQNHVPFMNALTNEYFARHLYRIGDLEMSLKHFNAARDNYTTWGALAKARKLDEYTTVLCKDC